MQVEDDELVLHMIPPQTAITPSIFFSESYAASSSALDCLLLVALVFIIILVYVLSTHS